MTIIEKAMRSAAARKDREREAQESETTAPPAVEETAAAAAAIPPVEQPEPAVAAPPATETPAAAAGRIVAFRRLAEQQLLLDIHGQPTLTAELRHLKRAVIRAAFGELAEPGSNVAMLTSAMPGAGKTFLSGNLALALAMERDSRVLLIDADNTRATLTRALGLREKKGFFDLLHDASLKPEDYILPTDRPAMSVLPTGTAFPDALELLSSQRARELIQTLQQTDPGRIILLDSPPLLATPDASALASLAGQVLMIVEAGETTEDEVEQALQLVDTQKPVGLILNKIPRSRLLAYKGAYYYYGYSAADQAASGATQHG